LKLSELYQKPLPHDLSAEMACLGAAMIEPKVWPDIRFIVTAGDFYDEQHVAIFDAVERAYAANPDADGVMFQAELTTRGHADLGDYLRRMLSETPSAAGGIAYAKIVAEHARVRRLIDACDRIVHDALHNHDADEVCDAALKSLSAAITKAGKVTEVQLVDAARRVVERMERHEVDHWPTGIQPFDGTFRGVPRTGVVAVIGVPGSGKSSLAADIVQNTAIGGLGWMVFSREMSGERIAANMLASRSGVDIGEMQRHEGFATFDKHAAIKLAISEYERVDVRFVEDSLTPAQIRSRAMLGAQQGIRGFLLDYIQDVPPSYPQQDESDRAAEIMRYAREVSKAHGALFVVVTQPTLAACRDDRPPKPSDGKGAQEIFAGADVMLGTYRSAAFQPRRSDEDEFEWAQRRTEAQIHVLKNKHGRTGFVNCTFTPELTRFQ
jgi:replicative DNA helicase